MVYVCVCVHSLVSGPIPAFQCLHAENLELGRISEIALDRPYM